jgi:putative phosphoesterase
MPRHAATRAHALMRIGLIADTHGLLRPEAIEALRGSDRILHAGDIGDPSILAVLETLAPLTAIRGNNDTADWARDLPDTAHVVQGGVAIYLIHDLRTLAAHPPPAQVDVIVAGHSHRPGVEARDGVLYVNPGSAGRRRFSLPITVGELRIDAGRCEARILPLPVER